MCITVCFGPSTDLVMVITEVDQLKKIMKLFSLANLILILTQESVNNFSHLLSHK